MPHAITAGRSESHKSSSSLKAYSVPVRHHAVHSYPRLHPAELLHPSRSDAAGLCPSMREALRAVADTVTARPPYVLVEQHGAGTHLPLGQLRRRFPESPVG